MQPTSQHGVALKSAMPAYYPNRLYFSSTGKTSCSQGTVQHTVVVRSNYICMFEALGFWIPFYVLMVILEQAPQIVRWQTE